VPHAGQGEFRNQALREQNADMDRFPFNPDTIRMLADILLEKGLSEIEIANRDNRIRVVVQAPRAPDGQMTRLPAESAGSRQRPAGNGGPPTPADPHGAAREDHPGAILSPMVGIAYLGPQPDAPPFVSVGQRVDAGQTLLLVEAMKSFTPIAAPLQGIVARILVENGAMVEFGETLMLIE
jgi:acetyl-CoA carboxylase biotin carboxyl carrier protein